MKILIRLLLFTTILLLPIAICGQQTGEKAGRTAAPVANLAVSSSPAYAEIVLRRAEIQSELESLILDYTEEYPKVKELRFTLSALQRESEKLYKLKPADWVKLTLALGKLIVRKAELETEAWKLLANFKEEHPDVKRARKKVEIYEAAIKEILG